MKLNQNVVEKKQSKLARLTKKSCKALALVNKTIDGLASVNADIEQTVAEIDQYQQMLAETRTGLDAELHKNQQIMQNFKSLLCVE